MNGVNRSARVSSSGPASQESQGQHSSINIGRKSERDHHCIRGTLFRHMLRRSLY